MQFLRYKKYYLFWLACAGFARIECKPVITLFIQPAFQVPHTKTTNELDPNVCVPGKMTSKILRNYFFSTGAYDGIFATYAGYLAISGYNGQLTFPRKHQQPAITIIITPTINPVFMLTNIVHHWELVKNLAVHAYRFTLKNDPNSDIYYWHIEKIDPPSSGIIPLDSIVLFANPKHIKISEGNFPGVKSANLILPPIFTTKKDHCLRESLAVLNIDLFFSPIKFTKKKDSDLYYISTITE